MIALRGAIRHASKTKSSSSITATKPYTPQEMEAFNPMSAKEGEWIWTGHWAFGSLPDPEHLEAVLEQAKARSRGRPSGGGGSGGRGRGSASSSNAGRKKKPPSGVRPFVYKFQKIADAKDVTVPSAESSDNDENSADDSTTATTANEGKSEKDQEQEKDADMNVHVASTEEKDGKEGNIEKGNERKKKQAEISDDKHNQTSDVDEKAKDIKDVKMMDGSDDDAKKDSDTKMSLEPAAKKPRLESNADKKDISDDASAEKDAKDDKKDIPSEEEDNDVTKDEKKKQTDLKDTKTVMSTDADEPKEDTGSSAEGSNKNTKVDVSSDNVESKGDADHALSKEQESQKTTFAEVSEGGTFTDGGLTSQHRMRVPIGGCWKGYFENVSRRKDRMTSRVQETFHLFFNSTPPADARMEFDLDDKNFIDSNDDSENKSNESDARVLPPGYLHVRGAGRNQFGTFEIIGGYNVETGILSCQRIYVQTNDNVDEKRSSSSERTKTSVSTPVRKSYFTRKRPAVSFRKGYSGDAGRSATGEGGGRRSSGSSKKRPRTMSESASPSHHTVGTEGSTPGTGGRKRSTSTSSAVLPALDSSAGVTTDLEASPPESHKLHIQTKFLPRTTNNRRLSPGKVATTNSSTSRSKPKSSPHGGTKGPSSKLSIPKAGNPLDARWRAAHFLYYHRQTEAPDGASSSPSGSNNSPNPVTPTRTHFVIYEGEMIEGNNIRDGRGVCLFNNNRLYEGGWKRNKEHGQGTLLTADRSRTIYEGDWERGKMHGTGTYYYHMYDDDERDNPGNGGKYIGEFKENTRHGTGAYTLPDGSVYEGEWRDDVPCGKGSFRWADGSIYTGHWKNGKRHGWGKLEVSDGFCYDGMWVNNAMEGKGSAIYPNGQKYDGNWLNGQRDGRGTVVFGNGAVYKGRFKEDCMEGQGTLKIDRNVSVPKVKEKITDEPVPVPEEKGSAEDAKKDADGDVQMVQDKVEEKKDEVIQEDDWMIPIEFQSDIGHIHQKAGFTTGGE